MHALAAQGIEQKRKTCIHFSQMNLFSKWYYSGNTLPQYITGIWEPPTSSSLFSAIFS